MTNMTAEEIYCALIHGPFTADGDVDTESWTREQFRTLLALEKERIERMKRHIREAEWLDSTLAPIYKLHPDISPQEAIEELPESDRTKAFSVLKSLDQKRPLIFECREEYRKTWHGFAEAALTVALHEPGMIFPQKLACKAGIDPEHTEEAARYIEAVIRESAPWRIYDERVVLMMQETSERIM
jgi:hypothetical protein